MAGILPGTRPLAASYGEELENEKPVRNPKLEADATNYNDLRADVARCAQTVPLAVVYVSDVPAIVDTMGIDVSKASISGGSAGVYVDVTLSADVVFTIQHAYAMANHATANVTRCSFTRGSRVVRVYISAATPFSLFLH